MSNQEPKNSTGEVAKGLFLLIILSLLVLWALATVLSLIASWIIGLMQTLSSLDAAIAVALITGCVSIFTMVFGSILKEYLSYRYQKLEFVRDRRERPYRKLVEINFKMLRNSKMSQEYTAKEMMDDYYEFGQELALWGSAKAIKLWDEWRLASFNGKTDAAELLLLMDKIMFQLRKDMGQKGHLTQGDILKLYINDFDEAIAKRKQSN